MKSCAATRSNSRPRSITCAQEDRGGQRARRLPPGLRRQNADAVAALRERKFRKEKPFALMAKNLEVGAAAWSNLTPTRKRCCTSVARPIVLAPRKDANCPASLRKIRTRRDAALHAAASSAVRRGRARGAGDDQRQSFQRTDRLSKMKTRSSNSPASPTRFLIGERPIARRVDDSVARVGVFGPAILRRARGYAPGVAATFPTSRPILGARRGPQEHDHAGRRWPGVRQPAHRRSRSLRIVLRVPRNHPRPARDV